jgi:hypothetical protein
LLSVRTGFEVAARVSPRWRVHLNGKRLDLDTLEALFSEGAIRVASGETVAIIEADCFDGLADTAAVSLIANRVIALLNAIAELRMAGYQAVQLGLVVRIQSEAQLQAASDPLEPLLLNPGPFDENGRN